MTPALLGLDVSVVDEVVIFRPLGQEQIKQVVGIQLRGLRQRLEGDRRVPKTHRDAASVQERDQLTRAFCYALLECPAQRSHRVTRVSRPPRCWPRNAQVCL